MALAPLQNISGDVTQELVAIGDNISNISSILLTNTHATDGVTIDLYINDTSNSYYLIKGHVLVKGAYLVLDSKHVTFNNSAGGFGLYIKLNNTDSALDVHIKR